MRILAIAIISVLVLGSACNSSKKSVEKSSEKTVETDMIQSTSKVSATDLKETGTSTVASQDTIRIENDELEYEILILEIGFNNWLATQPPMTFFSLNVLENRNRNYVFEWNQRAANPSAYNPNLYNQFIDYEPTIRYGLEVNYMLFMYFEFFQEKYRQRL